MANSLLVLDVDVEIPEQDDAALGPYAIPAAGKFARLHEPLHDVDPVFLIEGDARHFVEADHVILANQPALAGRHVDEHSGDRRLSTRDQMRVGRNLLE